jgi:putative SOS response-associated peptidase YedK
MCNRYRPSSVTRVKDAYGTMTVVEEREPKDEDGAEPRVPPPLVPYATTGIGPWQQGPFVHAGGLAVGQWGLIPWFSKTRRPTGKTGKPISTNNCRIEGVATAPSFKGPWARGQRCLIPAMDYDEPYWGTGKNIWWRFARKDGADWALGGLWTDWTDPVTGEIVLSYTMLTQNCDGHPLLSLMHKPDPALPPDAQDKRSVVVIERADWDTWLHGSVDEALALVRLSPPDLFSHGPADPAVQVQLPGWGDAAGDLLQLSAG